MDRLRKGFTLVELLIVIALLGVIALIVVAAINPIEQSNRARDTRFKSDASQLLSAVERYFATKQEFPWVTSVPATYTNDSAFGFVTAGGTNSVGVCGATCSADGILITGNELKTEFRSRDFIAATAADKQIMLGKGQGTSSSVYACYVPQSKAVRDKAVADAKVYTISTTNGTRTSTTSCNTTWANTCYVCVPE